MEESQVPYRSIDEYIAQSAPEVQETLSTLRRVIKGSAPGAKEKISFRMPAFEQHGTLVWFAAHKNHIGFYPTSSGIAAFENELSGYKKSKGAVQLPIGQPLPYDLISRIVQFRVAENVRRAESKSGNKK